VVRSFSSTPKLELDLDAAIGDRASTRATVLSWMAGWCNRVRLHSSLSFAGTVTFEAGYLD
jgi:hypothetical protein